METTGDAFEKSGRLIFDTIETNFTEENQAKSRDMGWVLDHVSTAVEGQAQKLVAINAGEGLELEQVSSGSEGQAKEHEANHAGSMIDQISTGVEGQAQEHEAKNLCAGSELDLVSPGLLSIQERTKDLSEGERKNLQELKDSVSSVFDQYNPESSDAPTLEPSTASLKLDEDVGSFVAKVSGFGSHKSLREYMKLTEVNPITKDFCLKKQNTDMTFKLPNQDIKSKCNRL